MRLNSKITRILAIIVVVFTGLVAGGCASDKSIIDQANKMHSGLDPAVMSDRILANYIQAVGDRVVEVGKEMGQQKFGPESHFKEDSTWMYDEKKMQFHLVNSDTVNAFTTGGEHMYLYRKLFELSETEDEMAAVVAHEYAHVYGRHVHKGMNRQMAMLGAAAVAGGAGYAAGGKDDGMEYAQYAAAATMVAGNFIGMGFTRGDEAEADYLGFEFYVRAGWDPAKFGDFFQRMIDMGFDTTPEMLSDHPTLKSRKEQADKWARELPANLRKLRRPNVANATQFAKLKQHAGEVGKTMPTDKQLADAQKMLQAFPRSCWSPAPQEDQVQAAQTLQQQVEPADKKAAQKPKPKPKKKPKPTT